MDYIYTELDPKLLADDTVYYGYSKTLPIGLPADATKCEDYSHFKSEGWCEQIYQLEVSDYAKYGIFAYPKSFGELDHIYNGVFDVKNTWVPEIIRLKNIEYYMYVTYNRLAPGFTTKYKFEITKEGE